jgi:hypothetical protein
MIKQGLGDKIIRKVTTDTGTVRLECASLTSAELTFTLPARVEQDDLFAHNEFKLAQPTLPRTLVDWSTLKHSRLVFDLRW